MVNRNFSRTDRHYVLGEQLDSSKDYSDQGLSKKTATLPIEHQFDDDGVLVSTRPVKRKVLGTLGVMKRRAETPVLAIVSNVVY